ncbi:MAG: AAA family ATPase [Alphaproteobacteria bacterium]|nr:AAA family ATPase [Alphaproteobacteria bacterium]
MINTDKNLFLQSARNVIAITSGVGTMGKTWLSITLAHALNTLKHSVLLFDADNGLLNIESQLDLKKRIPLNEAVIADATLNQTIISYNRHKFDMTVGTAGSDILAAAPIGRLQILKDDLLLLARQYDDVIIDLPDSEKIMTHFLPQGSDLILVCTDSPSNIVATYMFLQNYATTEKCKNLQIIVNYAQSYEDGLQTYNTLRRACEKYISATPALLGVVRRDTRVRDAIRNRVLLINRYPNSEAAEDVLQIARKLIKKEEEENARI